MDGGFSEVRVVQEERCFGGSIFFFNLLVLVHSFVEIDYYLRLLFEGHGSGFGGVGFTGNRRHRERGDFPAVSD